MEKYTRQEVTPVEKENERDETYEASNPQINSDRTKNNYHIVSPKGSYIAFINERISSLTLKRKLRSDAIYMNSFVLGSDGLFFQKVPPWKHREFFEDCVKFFADKYGEENIISAIVHEDETTPHLHLNIVPIVNGKLCSKDLFDRTKLSVLQTEFYQTVGKKWGLERGKEGSQAKHISAAEYKAKEIIKTAERKAEKIEKENQPYTKALEQAKQGNYAKSKGGLKEQVIAVTADNTRYRNENRDLLSRLDVSMGEALKYAKRVDELEAGDARKTKAVTLLAKLQRETPEAFEQLIHPTSKPKSNNNFKF